MQIYRLKLRSAKDGNQTIFLLVSDYSEITRYIEQHTKDWLFELRELKLIAPSVTDARRDSSGTG